MSATLKIIQPELLLDEHKCIRNIERLCEKMRAAHVFFRPHFKTHQSREIGRWFRDYQVNAITVSSLRMAHYFADDGWSDITVAFPVNLLEKELINHLAHKIQLNLVAEDPQVIRDLDKLLQHPAGLFLKMDTGSHRTGIDPSDIAAVEACVQATDQSKQLTWKGFLSHAGHAYQVRDDAKRMQSVYQEALKEVISLKAHLRDKHPDIILTFGDTPGASMLEHFDGIDEMRPGNFVFYDIMQAQIGSCDIQDVAVAMVCPVVAVHPKREECILYGGGIHFSKDFITHKNGNLTYGMAVPFIDGRWQADQEIGYLRTISQEHGVMRFLSGYHDAIRPGGLVAVLPVHSCMTAQCMAGYLDQQGRVIDHFAASDYYLRRA